MEAVTICASQSPSSTSPLFVERSPTSDRLKELGRNWLAGRVQRMFAQRVTRYRMPEKNRHRGQLVVVARESFSQSGAHRLDPVDPDARTGGIAIVDAPATTSRSYR